MSQERVKPRKSSFISWLLPRLADWVSVSFSSDFLVSYGKFVMACILAGGWGRGPDSKRHEPGAGQATYAVFLFFGLDSESFLVVSSGLLDSRNDATRVCVEGMSGGLSELLSDFGLREEFCESNAIMGNAGGTSNE